MTEVNARIPATTETRDRLRSMKQGSERYEDVLRRLIEGNE
jgi:predicted CopG family antitoxin